MTRQPGRKFETWKHPLYKIEVEVRVAPENGEYFATYGQTYLKDPSLATLRHKLREVIDEAHALKWIPVLRITIGQNLIIDNTVDEDATPEEITKKQAERNGMCGLLDLDVDRFWIAQTPGGTWRVCEDWDAAEDRSGERFTRSACAKEFRPGGHRAQQFTGLPYRWEEHRSFSEGKNVSHYLPYTDELWLGIHEVMARLGALSQRLGDLLGSDQGRKVLVANVRKMLPTRSGSSPTGKELP